MDDKYLEQNAGVERPKNMLISLTQLNIAIDRMDTILEIIDRIQSSLYGPNAKDCSERDLEPSIGSEKEISSMIDIVDLATRHINNKTTYIQQTLYRMCDFLGER